MQKKLLILLSFLFCVGSSIAQDTEREILRKQFETISPQQAKEYFSKHHSRKLSTEQLEVLKSRIQPVEQENYKKGSESINKLAMPEKKWFPGEWEPVQAIVVTWPYISVLKSNTNVQTSPVLAHIGINPYTNKMDSIISFPYTNKNDAFVKVFADVITGIQKGDAQAWINIWEPGDSTIIKNYMSQIGQPLKNYKFFVSYGNSFWYRDCGPVAFHYGDNDDVAFLDFEYYGGRALDDLLPIALSEQSGIPVYTTGLETEGGNILVDGVNKFFSSDAIYPANANTYGQLYLVDPTNINSYAYRTKQALSKKQVNDSIKYLTGLDPIMLPTLKYDGGTGHIDLYADMWDENNFVFSQFPEAYSSWVDYTIASKNIDSITTLHTTFGKKYKKSYIPFPTRDDGSNFVSQDEYLDYTRTYTNHTFVNKVILQPVFNDGKTGAIEADSIAIIELKKQYPGYEIIPIDVREFNGSGGAIHCITKQIPAPNPIRILHDPIDANVTAFSNGYEVAATVTNKAFGIKEVYCGWRKKTNAPANEVPFTNTTLTKQASDIYKGTIGASLTSTDTIEYFIAAITNNDMRATKPITAANGCYEIFSGKSTDITNINISTFEIGNFYPNPTQGNVKIEISNPNKSYFDIQVFNSIGQVVYSTSINEKAENMIFEMNTTSFAKGFYTVVFRNGKESISRKLIVE